MTSEPISSAVTLTAAAGVWAALSHVMGIDTTLVGWAMAGGFFGASLAPSTSRLRAAVQYVAACMLSALVATATHRALQFTHDEYVWLLAAAVSISFYPLKAWLVARIPAVLDRWLQRVFGIAPQADDDRPGSGGAQS